MKEWMKNVLRSGVVVIGSVAFAHLTFKLVFKPYVEKTQLEFESLHNHESQSSSSSSITEPFDDDTNTLISDKGFLNSDDS